MCYYFLDMKREYFSCLNDATRWLGLKNQLTVISNVLQFYVDDENSMVLDFKVIYISKGELFIIFS